MEKEMDERQKILMEISIQINKLRETDIYSLEVSTKVELMGDLQNVENKIDLMICRLEKQGNN